MHVMSYISGYTIIHNKDVHVTPDEYQCFVHRLAVGTRSTRPGSSSFATWASSGGPSGDGSWEDPRSAEVAVVGAPSAISSFYVFVKSEDSWMKLMVFLFTLFFFGSWQKSKKLLLNCVLDMFINNLIQFSIIYNVSFFRINGGRSVGLSVAGGKMFRGNSPRPLENWQPILSHKVRQLQQKMHGLGVVCIHCLYYYCTYAYHIYIYILFYNIWDFVDKSWQESTKTWPRWYNLQVQLQAETKAKSFLHQFPNNHSNHAAQWWPYSLN